MLVIRKAQIEALAAHERERFEARMVERLAVRFPDEHRALGPEGTRRLVGRAIDAASAHGIDDWSSLATFIELSAEFGEAFELSPDAARAAAILDDGRLPGQIKIVLLAECLTERTGGRRFLRAEPAAAREDAR
jgi:hypothetical protein